MDRIEPSHSVAISRQQFKNGECQSEEEVFKEMEDMLDEMHANGECR